MSAKALNEKCFGPTSRGSTRPASGEHRSQDRRTGRISMLRPFLEVGKQRAVPHIGAPPVGAAKRMFNRELKFVGADESPKIGEGSCHGRDPQPVHLQNVGVAECSRPHGRRSPPRGVNGNNDVLESRALGEPLETMKASRSSVTDGSVRPTPSQVRVEAIEPALIGIVGFVLDIDSPTDSDEPVGSSFALKGSGSDAVVGAGRS